MARRIAVAAALSFLLVTTLLAILDYLKVVYQPVTDADWHAHYASLVATPIEVTILAYAQALSDFLRSPLPSLAVGAGTALLLLLQLVLFHWRSRRITRLNSAKQLRAWSVLSSKLR
jgi:hypothetical protein